jgi:hypothetical protein
MAMIWLWAIGAYRLIPFRRYLGGNPSSHEALYQIQYEGVPGWTAIRNAIGQWESWE